MLKFVLNFRTRGVRDCCVAGLPDQKFTWLLHCFYMPVAKKCGGLMVTGDMYSYISDLFFCRLALRILELEHIVWRLHIFQKKGCIFWIWRGKGGLRDSAVFHSFCVFFHPAALFHCLWEKRYCFIVGNGLLALWYCRSKKLYCNSWLYCISYK